MILSIRYRSQFIKIPKNFQIKMKKLKNIIAKRKRMCYSKAYG